MTRPLAKMKMSVIRDGVHVVRCPDGTVRLLGDRSFSWADGIGDSLAVILLHPEWQPSAPAGGTG